MNDKRSIETRERANEMRRHFFVPFDAGVFFENVSITSSRVEHNFLPPVKAFAESLAAVVHTVSVPFLLASTSTHDKRYQRFMLAERIRAETLDQVESESAEEFEKRKSHTAVSRASEKMEEFASSDKGIDQAARETADMLLSVLDHEPFAMAARELLLQGAVGTWSALEVFVKDELEILLNHNPRLVSQLQADPIASKRFEFPRLSLEDLAMADFDLSGRMGTLLFSSKDFSDLRGIKAACHAIFPDKPVLREKLNEPQLWHLNQERHIIVHRRGVIDQSFIQNTGSALAVGSPLRVDPDRLERYLHLVRDTGIAFAEALAE